MTDSLDLAHLREQNVSRLLRWHGDDDGWTLADWSNAMAGEAGEACNIVKKIRRTETALWDKQTYPGDGPHTGGIAHLSSAAANHALLDMLANEAADVVCYLDLLCYHAGIDLGKAVKEKFNRVSEAQGFPEHL